MPGPSQVSRPSGVSLTEPPLPRFYRPELPVEVEHLVLRSLGTDPAERPTPDEFARSLRAIVTANPDTREGDPRQRARFDVVADDSVF